MNTMRALSKNRTAERSELRNGPPRASTGLVAAVAAAAAAASSRAEVGGRRAKLKAEREKEKQPG